MYGGTQAFEEGLFGIGLRVDILKPPHEVKSHNLIAPDGSAITEVRVNDNSQLRPSAQLHPSLVFSSP